MCTSITEQIKNGVECDCLAQESISDERDSAECCSCLGSNARKLEFAYELVESKLVARQPVASHGASSVHGADMLEPRLC